jgi:uncharacterized repeat protein (TIGR03803 family)
MKLARVLLHSFGVLAMTMAGAPAQTFTNLHSFAGSPGDGASPNGGLLLFGSALYGATYDGGSANNGVIFTVNTNSTGYSVLKHFSASTTNAIGVSTNNGGANPLGALTLGGGTLYGVSSQAGSSGSGTLFSLNTNGSGFSVFKNFSPRQSANNTNDDGARPNAGLVLLGDTLYGTTLSGGNFGNGTVFKVNTNGTGFTNLHSFSGSDGTNSQAALVLDGDTLYGTTRGGGSGGQGTLFKVGTNGTGFTVIKNFPPVTNTINSDGAMPSPNLVLSGNTLYGTADLGGLSGNGTVFKVDTDGTGFTVLRSFSVRISSTNVDGAFPTWGLVLSEDTLYGTTQIGGADGKGSLFALKTNGTGFVVFHNFTPAEGDPAGNLVLLGDTFYGTTENSSLNGFGTVFSFQLPPSGSPSTGALQVTLSPLDAVTAGAQWQVDGGVFQDSGTILADIPFGNHLLTFKTVAGWTVPGTQVVVISGGATNTRSGTYAPAATTGALQVTINPPAAVSAGAQWQVDGGTFLNSDVVAGNLGVSNHTVSFKNISGWVTPGNQTVAVTPGVTNDIVVSYTQPDTVKPKIVITAPTPNLLWSSDAFTAAGTATDNVAVASVYLQLNNGVWINATTANSWTNWTAAVTLTPGTNTLRAYALDSSGNNSGTNSVNFTYALATVLGVQIVGNGTVTPNLNGQSLQIGVRYTMTAKPGKGYKFSGWTGSLTTNKTVLTFFMQSNYAFTATFTDFVKPALAITAPKRNLHWSNALFSVTGKVKDNGPLANVFYQLNGGGWSNAVSVNGFSNWNASVTLTPGLDKLAAYAVDAQGNLSKTTSVSFTYVLSAPLIVATNGFGTVSPNYNNHLLQISNTYLMTAKAGKGFLFVNWTGSPPAPVTTPKISFTMASNLFYTANFVDITRPVNIITSPVVNQKWSNSVFNAAGKASDNVGVSSVSYQLNGAGWNPAILALNHTNWSTINLTLLSGSNMIQAFAMDVAGNASLTNSVKFTCTVLPVVDWAPDSLNGLLAQAAPSNGSPESIGFDLTSFAQSGTDTDTNRDDFGVGNYTYNKTGTNTGQLTLSFASPPAETNDTGSVDLIFTNHYAGYFTNTNSGDFGGINLVVATNFVPGSLAGKTVAAVQSDGSQTNTLNLVNAVGFTKTPANNGGGGSSSGTYTFTRFSPVCGLLTLTFTNTADLGSVVYVQTIFTNSTAGNYFVTSFDNLGVLQDTGTGRFTVR